MRSFLIMLLFFSCGKQSQEKTFVNYYILAGQSNVGRPWFPGNGKNGPVISQDNFQKYGSVITGFKIYNARYDSVFNDIQAGINTMLYNPASWTEFGSEVSLFTEMKNSGHAPAYLTKLGYGKTDMATMWIPGGQCNKLLKQQVAKSIELIKAEGKIPILRGFIWMQGENDAIIPDYAARYYINLIGFFSDFDSWYKSNKVPVLPYKKIIGRLALKNDTSGVVRAAQEKYCQVYHAILINTDNYEMYGIHYDAVGQIKFGLDLYNVLK